MLFSLHSLTLFQIIAPWRLDEFTTRFQGRQDLLKYASENGIPVSVTPKAPWSMDANLMHISYESGILENPDNEPPKDLYLMTKDPKEAPDEAVRVEIKFERGLPVQVKSNAGTYETALDIFLFLNEIGGRNGVGRIDIVENRFLGLKVSVFFVILVKIILNKLNFSRGVCTKLRPVSFYIQLIQIWKCSV